VKLLAKTRSEVKFAHFVEGMACEGGCIGGAGCLSHVTYSSARIDLHGKKGKRKISDATKGVK